MTRQKKLLGILAAAWLSLPNVASAFSGTEGASFLEIPVGGRPAALGNAYSALASDAYSPIYNAGGLGLLETTQLAGMHISYLDSINYEYATFVHPIAIGHSIGLSAQYLNPGKTTSRDASGNITGDFTGHFGAYSLAYGTHLGDHIGIGVTGKFIESSIAGEHATAYGGDVGAMFRPNSHWSLGATATNLGSKLKFIDQGDPLPQAYHASVAYAPNARLLLALEGIYRKNELGSGHAGIEISPVDFLSLRAGYRTDTTRELSAMAGFTTGVGIHVFGQEFDYAWVPVGDLGTTHYFSLVLRFSHADNEKRNLIYYKERNSNPADIESSAYYDPPFPDLEPTPQAAQQPGAQAGETIR